MEHEEKVPSSRLGDPSRRGVGSDQVWVRTREEVPQLFTDGQYKVAEGVRRWKKGKTSPPSSSDCFRVSSWLEPAKGPGLFHSGASGPPWRLCRLSAASDSLELAGFSSQAADPLRPQTPDFSVLPKYRWSALPLVLGPLPSRTVPARAGDRLSTGQISKPDLTRLGLAFQTSSLGFRWQAGQPETPSQPNPLGPSPSWTT